jgi:cell division inhibitor SepF
VSTSGVWQKALVYLGLWEESGEPYDDVPLPDDEPDRVEAEEGRGNVRPLRLAPEPPATPRTAVVEVARFEDCEQIGGHFREGRAVLFDLAAVDRTTARRVIDFVSGLTYALHGGLEKVASRAFVLTPEGVVLGDDERLRLEAHGYRFADGA